MKKSQTGPAIVNSSSSRPFSAAASGSMGSNPTRHGGNRTTSNSNQPILQQTRVVYNSAGSSSVQSSHPHSTPNSAMSPPASHKQPLSTAPSPSGHSKNYAPRAETSREQGQHYVMRPPTLSNSSNPPNLVSYSGGNRSHTHNGPHQRAGIPSYPSQASTKYRNSSNVTNLTNDMGDRAHFDDDGDEDDDALLADGAVRTNYQQDDEEEVSGDSFVSTTTTGTSSSLVSWITWYCSLPGHELFIEVPEEFIDDDFNLTNLQNVIPLYSPALDMILDMEPNSPSQNTASSGSSSNNTVAQSSRSANVEASAELLYGLLHARYIVTKPGLQCMADRLSHGEFGKCPRSGCGGAYVVPCGRYDAVGVDTVKMFCCRCCDLYNPKEVYLTGSEIAIISSTSSNDTRI